mgnify:FL=1
MSRLHKAQRNRVHTPPRRLPSSSFLLRLKEGSASACTKFDRSDAVFHTRPQDGSASSDPTCSYQSQSSSTPGGLTTRIDASLCNRIVASTRGGNCSVPEVNHKTSSSSTFSSALTRTLRLFSDACDVHRTHTLHGAASARGAMHGLFLSFGPDLSAVI